MPSPSEYGSQAAVAAATGKGNPWGLIGKLDPESSHYAGVKAELDEMQKRRSFLLKYISDMIGKTPYPKQVLASDPVPARSQWQDAWTRTFNAELPKGNFVGQPYPR